MRFYGIDFGFQEAGGKILACNMAKEEG